MKLERTRNASRNIVFGIAQRVYGTFMPFLMRTAMIYFMGVQYLGLNSLFASILQVLNLAELGIGNAIVYSMYKPIVEDDEVSICALMRLYKLYYRIIGLVIAAGGLILTPFIPYLVKGDIPSELNMYVLYILNLGATVLSYWLFAYKNSLLLAHQRVDITSKVSMITNTFQYVCQLIIIVFIKDYYLYVIVMLVTQALNNVITSIVAGKMFPHYKPKGKLSKDVTSSINQRIKDLFTAKIGGVVVNSADTVVISAFLGLSVLAIYQNYFFIVTSIIGFVSIVFQACMAGIGNSIIVESQKKNYADLQKFTFLIAWIAGWCSTCLLCLFQPFMTIWMRGDNSLMMGIGAVICLCIYYYVYVINQLLNTYKDAAGIWHEDRFRPLVTAVSNLILNLIMVQFMGIYGVLLSTVISMICVGMPWLLHNLFSTLFARSYLKSYIKKLVLYFTISFIACTVTFLIAELFKLEGWLALLLRGCLCIVIPNVIYYLSYKRLNEFEECVKLINNMTRGKIKILRYL